MKHLKVSEARAQFGEILDNAEKGLPVIIERRGVRFAVVVDKPSAPATAAPLFAHVDPDVLSGQWTWKPKKAGLTLAPRRKRR